MKFNEVQKKATQAKQPIAFIIAEKKITLRSGKEIEITAPEIDINGSNNVYIDGGRIDLNLPHDAPEA